LSEAAGNVTAAARSLNMSQSAFRRAVLRLGIEKAA
jgi:DNA-binding transcriptional LysR family regulator